MFVQWLPREEEVWAAREQPVPNVSYNAFTVPSQVVCNVIAPVHAWTHNICCATDRHTGKCFKLLCNAVNKPSLYTYIHMCVYIYIYIIYICVCVYSLVIKKD